MWSSSTEPTKHLGLYMPDWVGWGGMGGRSAQLLEWKPVLATDVKSTVLILYIETWKILITVVDEMNQWTADILCGTLDLTNRMANEMQAWCWVEHSWQTHRSLVGAELGKGGTCYRTAKISPMEELIHFSLAAIFLLLLLWPNFAAEHMFVSFSQVSSLDQVIANL